MRLTLILICLSAFGADHYVRAGASGTGTGADWTNACTWFTGSCAPASLVRGDTYYVASGTYTDANVYFNTAASGTSIITIKKATVAAHGTNTGWSDSYATGAASLIQSSANTAVVWFGSDYWVLDGVTGGGPSSWKSGHGFYIDTKRIASPAPGISCDAISHVSVSHVEIEGNGGDGDGGGGNTNDGFTVGIGTDVHLSHMYIHDQGRVNLFWRSSASSVTNSWMARNESTSGQHSEGAAVYSASTVRVSDVTFANNVWEDIEGTGIIVCTCDDVKVYNNTFFNTASYSGTGLGNGSVTTWTSVTCQIDCVADSEGATNFQVYNNTFADLVGAGGFLLPNANVSGNVAYNNLFFNIDSVGWTGVQTHDYNWFYDSGTQTETNRQAGAGDPFVNKAGGDFRLAAATDNGYALAAPFDVDTLGKSRFASRWDRGAYQFGQPTTFRGLLRGGQIK